MTEPMSERTAWEVLLLDALGIDDPDHASGPSDLLPLVRWAVEDVERLRDAIAAIRQAIESVDDRAWENGELDNDPLWEALDRIDAVVLSVSSA